MPKWEVYLPITGIACVTVDADSEEGAIDAGLSSCRRSMIKEWDVHRQIVRGKVFSGLMNDAEAVKIHY